MRALALPEAGTERQRLAARLHKLRGSAGTLGATELMQLAQALETGLVDNRPPAQLDARWRALQNALEALRRHSEPVLKAARRAAPSNTAPVPAGTAEADIPHFLELLQRQDLDALAWWKLHASGLRVRLGAATVERVGHWLDELDFASASAALTEELPP
ncbi:Hpt domain protein [compost metagenome]